MDNKTDRRRSSRYIRPRLPQPMRLTPRDKQVVRLINDFRVMRQDQIQRLVFPSRNTAQVRLRLLWEHGYLRRQFFPRARGDSNQPHLVCPRPPRSPATAG